MKWRLTLRGWRPRPGGLRRWSELAIWIVGGGALAGLVFGAAFYFSIQSALRSNEIGVPELVGLDLESASRAVEPFELVLQVVDQRHDPAVSSGRVIEQVPRSGAAVRRGRKVKLVMSLGGQVLEVPDLVGQASRAVEIELRQGGFIPGEEARIRSWDSPTGTVIGQVPPAASPAVPNSRVHRLVSDGPPAAVWVMPDLAGLDLAQADRWISSCGFRRGTVRRVRMAGRFADVVVGQSPLAGYPIRSRDVVELTLAQ